MISIVVPVYNAQKTIAQTIESVLHQSYHGFELILIDDGSQDASLDICKSFAEKDSRVHVFHYSNGGVTAARKLGVEHSRGDWITFVDADDLLTEDSLARLAACRENCDIVSASAFFCDENCENPKEPPIACDDKIIDGTCLAKEMIMEKVLWMPWGKLFRKDLFSSDIFNLPAGIRDGEDLIMNLRLAMNANAVRCILDKVYLYRLPSVSHSMNMKAKLKQLYYICSSVKTNKMLCILGVYKWLYRNIRKVILNK
ncbi:glycosyltransferase family 2 protein [Fibrobacter sp. UWH1]|uniref:glycosyltransferase family 2 protein n=1 Tax=Fibrobacter sp. UWH1 TaxID=1964354 RepID=UPI000B523D39|nr:glycosyltransferase family 2 protein [Fibrobacter sp. UWH1]OWV06480.1 hypothetical protein B7992_14850 [Fibrobacter sp. UWH1]